MNFSLLPTETTKRIIQNLNNADDLMRQAKVQALQSAATIMSTQAKTKVPRATGNLGRNIKTEIKPDGSEARVYNELDYAVYQEEGTGIYGKHKTPVVPKRAKYLRFKSKSGQIIYAKSVRGVKGVWFMKQGYEFLQANWNKVEEALYNGIMKGLFK
jgi:hypothetical protein